MKYLLNFIFMCFSFSCIGQVPLQEKDSSNKICGMYKSNYFKRDFYALKDNSNDTFICKGRPRKICDFIYFLPDSNKILYENEAWGSCSKIYKKDMFSDPQFCTVGQGDYETKGDTINIYITYKTSFLIFNTTDSAGIKKYILSTSDTTANSKYKTIWKRELLYSGIYKNGNLILHNYHEDMIYTRNHDLLFEKCLDCE